MSTQMDQYLIDSEKTLAGHKVHMDFFPTHSKVLHQAIDVVQGGITADAIKRSLFYGDKAIGERLSEGTQKMQAFYQLLESKEITLSEDEINLLHGILGIASEAGELMEELIEAKLTGREVNKSDGKGSVKEECGDVMWYQALILRYIGSTFEKVAGSNIAKLKARYPQKFTEENAVNRNLEEEAKALAS
jgi:NTP pyrophosphatase (non-canonical NTP hydrolase)